MRAQERGFMRHCYNPKCEYTDDSNEGRYCPECGWEMSEWKDARGVLYRGGLPVKDDVYWRVQREDDGL